MPPSRFAPKSWSWEYSDRDGSLSLSGETLYFDEISVSVYGERGYPISNIKQDVEDLGQRGPAFPPPPDAILEELFEHLGVKEAPWAKGYALLFRATAGDVQGVRSLLAEGVDVNSRCFSGRTALSRVLGGYSPEGRRWKEEHREIARALLQAGADVKGGILGWALGGDLFDLVPELLAHGAEINPPGDSRFSPLLTAISYKRPASIIRALLNAGADVNARDYTGKTPLTLAQGPLYGDPEVVRALKSAGARP